MLMFRVPSRTTMLLLLLGLCLLTRCGSGFLVAVEEGSDAILPCSLSANIEKKVFDWKKDDRQEVFLYADGSYYGNGRTGQDEQFEGRVSHFPDELKKGNASIKITNAKMSDNGSYTCTFPKQQTSHVTLVVDRNSENTVLRDRRPDDERAVLKPYLHILHGTKDGVPLQCEVLGTASGLKLNISLWDSSGTKLTDTELQDTKRGVYTLSTTVTKSDEYRCVATQMEIYHQVFTENVVTVPGLSAGSTAAIIAGVVVVVAVVLIVGYLIKKKCNNNNQGSTPEETGLKSQEQPGLLPESEDGFIRRRTGGRGVMKDEVQRSKRNSFHW